MNFEITARERAIVKIAELEQSCADWEEQLQNLLKTWNRQEAEGDKVGMHRTENLMRGLRRLQELNRKDIVRFKKYLDDPEALELFLSPTKEDA